jgi:hypothetical protein
VLTAPESAGFRDLPHEPAPLRANGVCQPERALDRAVLEEELITGNRGPIFGDGEVAESAAERSVNARMESRAEVEMSTCCDKVIWTRRSRETTDGGRGEKRSGLESPQNFTKTTENGRGFAVFPGTEAGFERGHFRFGRQSNWYLPRSRVGRGSMLVGHGRPLVDLSPPTVLVSQTGRDDRTILWTPSETHAAAFQRSVPLPGLR